MLSGVSAARAARHVCEDATWRVVAAVNSSQLPAGSPDAFDVRAAHDRVLEGGSAPRVMLRAKVEPWRAQKAH